MRCEVTLDELLAERTVVIRADLAAAILIADALDIVNPDDEKVEWFARHMAADIKAKTKDKEGD